MLNRAGGLILSV